MDITITKLEHCLPEKIIMEAWFDSSKTVDGVTVTYTSSIIFMRTGDSPTLIEYEDVTEAMVKQWITDEGIEDILDDKLRQINSPPTAVGFPW
jgi:hypothetical protein